MHEQHLNIYLLNCVLLCRCECGDFSGLELDCEWCLRLW